MPLTDDFEIPYPAGSDPAFVPNDLQALAERVEAVMDALVPIGMPRPWLTGTAPEWHIFLHGQPNMSRSTYAKLFAIWGTAFGAGDGSTTFGFPDLRGRDFRGADHGAGRLTNGDLGDVGGVERVALVIAELAQHHHGVNLTSQQASNGHKHGPGNLKTDNPGSHQHGSGTYQPTGTLHDHSLPFEWTSINSPASGTQVTVPRQGSSGSGPRTGDSFAGSGVSGSSGNGGSHDHDVTSGETATAGGDHTHGVSGNTGNRGAGDEHENLPPHLVGEWIVRYGP